MLAAALQKQRHNMIQQCVHFLRLEYYRYENTFGLYVMTGVMTPMERIVVNTFVTTSLLLLCWTLLLYFPPLLYQKFVRIVWVLAGHWGENADADAGSPTEA